MVIKRKKEWKPSQEKTPPRKKFMPLSIVEWQNPQTLSTEERLQRIKETFRLRKYEELLGRVETENSADSRT